MAEGLPGRGLCHLSTDSRQVPPTITLPWPDWCGTFMRFRQLSFLQSRGGGGRGDPLFKNKRAVTIMDTDVPGGSGVAWWP